MSWKQTLKPNLDNDPNNPLYVWVGGQILTDWYGWCLAVTAASYNAKGSSYSAKTAWQACQTKHYDMNIPQGVWVPLWYEGGQYGHVVMGYREGDYITVYSSPYTHKPSFEVFGGNVNSILGYIGQVYGVGSFTGWSETLLDSRVIELVEATPTPEPTPEPEPTDDNGKDDMETPEKPDSQQLIGGIIEEASESGGFTFSSTTKLVAYLVGDALIVGALLAPDIINCIESPNLTIFGEYLAKVLLEAGTCILMIFKLIKKKS